MLHQPEPAPRILPSLSHENGTPLDSARRSQVLGFAVIRSAIHLQTDDEDLDAASTALAAAVSGDPTKLIPKSPRPGA